MALKHLLHRSSGALKQVYTALNLTLVYVTLYLDFKFSAITVAEMLILIYKSKCWELIKFWPSDLVHTHTHTHKKANNEWSSHVNFGQKNRGKESVIKLRDKGRSNPCLPDTSWVRLATEPRIYVFGARQSFPYEDFLLSVNCPPSAQRLRDKRPWTSTKKLIVPYEKI